MSDIFPKDAEERKEYPMYSGLIKYFPKALAAVSRQSHIGGKQHGHETLHWDRNKSSDDADACVRHITEGDWAAAAWRALAALEKSLEGQAVSSLIEADQDDEWIEWSGGACPVASDQMVEVVFPDGVTATEMAGTLCWGYIPYKRITHYRLIKE